jgi:hypothetical protein
MACLLLFCSLQNIAAIQQDNIPPTVDGVGYYLFTLETYRKVMSGSLEGLKDYIYHSDIRPPLVQVFIAALFLLTKAPSLLVARLGMLFFLWILLLSTYAIGAKLKDTTTGLVAAVLLACYPQVIGFSRIYWMDLPTAAMVSLCLFVLLTTDYFRRSGRCILWGVTLGVGMLTKLYFAIFVAGPSLYLFCSAWKMSPPSSKHDPWLSRIAARKRLLLHLLSALLIAALLAATWYVPHLHQIRHNFFLNQGTDVIPGRSGWTTNNAFSYLECLYQTQMGVIPFALLLAALPFFLRYATKLRRAFLLLWITVPFFFFTFILLGVWWSRFTLPYLPALALLTAMGLLQFRFSSFSHLAAGATCLVAIFLYLFFSHLRPLPPIREGFTWDRVQEAGMVRPQSLGFFLDPKKLFPLLVPKRRTHVAIFPDYAGISSILDFSASIEQLPLSFWQAYDPELAPTFGGRYPSLDRLHDPSYLLKFNYILHVLLPPLFLINPERTPGTLRAFEKLWQDNQRFFELINERRLPNGYRLLVYQRNTRHQRHLY